MTAADRAAAEAIARKLRERGDPDVAALEIVTLIRGLGWRPTEARPQPEWHRPTGSGTPPTGSYLAARAELDEHLGHREEAS